MLILNFWINFNLVRLAFQIIRKAPLIFQFYIISLYKIIVVRSFLIQFKVLFPCVVFQSSSLLRVSSLVSYWLRETAFFSSEGLVASTINNQQGSIKLLYKLRYCSIYIRRVSVDGIMNQDSFLGAIKEISCPVLNLGKSLEFICVI